LRTKAQGLLNGARWIEQEYGHEALRDVLHACSPAVRDRYTSVIAINWHPVEEFIEFVCVAERVLGVCKPRGRIAEEIGAAGARANTKGTLIRLAAWIARPETLIRRAAGMWRQFNDQGLFKLVEIGDSRACLELTGLPAMDRAYCAVITGWCREVGIAVGAVAPLARHVECKTQGGNRCLWEVRYARIGARISQGT
jgi:hypothetical protein